VLESELTRVRRITHLFVWGLNIVGCSSIAEKKSTMGLLGSGLAGGAAGGEIIGFSKAEDVVGAANNQLLDDK
jgi:hypothetical protein